VTWAKTTHEATEAGRNRGTSTRELTRRRTWHLGTTWKSYREESPKRLNKDRGTEGALKEKRREDGDRHRKN